MEKTKTFLPIFSGFYNTIHGSIIDNAIDNVLEENEKLSYEDLEIDYDKFRNDYCKEVVAFFKKELKEKSLLTDIIFEHIRSPRFYNFSNDDIHVEIVLSEENKKNIANYIKENKKLFTDYIKSNYTSYDGFMSFYSNDANVWIEEYTDHLTVFDKNTHYLGSILNFICENDGITDNDIYSYVSENIFGDEYISNKTEECAS